MCCELLRSTYNYCGRSSTDRAGKLGNSAQTETSAAHPVTYAPKHKRPTTPLTHTLHWQSDNLTFPDSCKICQGGYVSDDMYLFSAAFCGRQQCDTPNRCLRLFDYSVCIRVPAPTCQGHVCPVGQKCALVLKTPCTKLPCDPKPDCVSQSK